MKPINESVITNVINQPKVRVKRQKKWDAPLTGYLFISPWLLGLFLLTLYPMLQSLYFSFTDYSLLEAPNWVGIENYQKIFLEDKLFYKSLSITLFFVILSVPLKLITALLMAMFLNQKLKGISIYRTLVYLPSLIGTSVAVAILWSNIFGSDGIVNGALSLFGISGRSWIGSPDTALGTLILLVVWQFGSSMVIFLAGLKQISPELYEASAVDGATKIRQFFLITLPMLSPVILFNLVLQTIGSFQMFTQAFVITKGGPIQSTYMFALYLYERAFARFEMGYASALAWILLVIIGIVTALIFISSRYWVFYESEKG
ncbi:MULTISPECIES: carbohydrate ABC transporter permease [Metabacillus]|uniref:Sugar ABC transporter permease n=1 Tax=Metabacillus hrfriensis TaxID=3048891 RepID=A0ACD4RFS5_9BACI|nr:MULTISPECIES: sugar ABC transporter permease [Metabacillus]UAL53805.1 sugar ABC transporter permease [Metabacillus dongyingensis]UOK59219.1 sugar ABC transporter permease [Bacillus sp. OVS6]USK30117.1 sugar ABC transporter permease [Bacillus sp. CMF21]WHZ59361.1 sugar ABC transporter permease [Metabacillus sp. CT-WN-B3]